MDSLKNLSASKRLPRKKDPHLHSPAHLLADELATRFNDHKHFGFYLKLAYTHHPDVLRKLAGQVMESHTVKTPGRLFAYLIKQHNQELKNDSANSKTPSQGTSKQS
jgi:hypothetical protein